MKTVLIFAGVLLVVGMVLFGILIVISWAVSCMEEQEANDEQ